MNSLVNMTSGSDHRQEALHVYDALYRPVRTFPSFIGKSAPGGTSERPLHRLMDGTQRRRNHDASVSICEDVWGPDYTDNGMECDEYPFQSTYEGSYVSTNGQPQQWQGSARPIDGDDNGNGGTALANFYGANRILDSDAFLVAIES